MTRTLKLMWKEEDGLLSFEWTLLTVLVVFGVVGGLAAGRDALIDELGDMAEGVLSLDQSFSFTGIPNLGILGSSYVDAPGTIVDCGRQAPGSWGIPGRNDAAGGG